MAQGISCAAKHSPAAGGPVEDPGLAQQGVSVDRAELSAVDADVGAIADQPVLALTDSDPSGSFGDALHNAQTGPVGM